MDMSFITPILMFALIIAMIIQIVNTIKTNLSQAGLGEKEIIPKFAGERVKKEDINAAKFNKCNAKKLYLSEDGNYEGGFIGWIVGIVPCKDFTKFIIKRHIIGSKKILFCRRDKHTNLHGKEVMMYGYGIVNDGGIYWVKHGNNEREEYKFVKNRFETDIIHKTGIDLAQIEQKQILSAIGGTKTEKEIRERPEKIEEYIESEEETE